MAKLSEIGVLKNVSVDVCTPIGTIKVPARIVKTDVEGCDYKDADFELIYEGKTININLAVLYAAEDMESQNLQADAMEKKYDRPQGRYRVKDMAISGVSIDSNGIFNVYFVWTDCYDGKRVYRGHDCKIKEGVNGLYIKAHRPRFYF